MNLHSIGLRSDLLVLRGLSEIQAHDDRVVVRTPSEPNFWFGNMVIFRHPPEGAHGPGGSRAQVARARADFPDARHVCLIWDVPDLLPGPGHEALRESGFVIDRSEVMTLTGPIQPAAPPPGIALRPIVSDAEWRAVCELQTETGLEDGHDPAEYATFVTNRFANRRRQAEAGAGAWFGAFDGARLVGDLGLYHDGETARYQSVETRASHRRRGICPALVSFAHDWAAARAQGLTYVIIADADSAAGRLYRRRGFALTETGLAAFTPDYAGLSEAVT